MLCFCRYCNDFPHEKIENEISTKALFILGLDVFLL